MILSRYNTADMCVGAGIRLGGHVVEGFVYGVDNHVRDVLTAGVGYTEHY